MESELRTPGFYVGQDVATFLVSCGLLPQVWEESIRASNAESFTLNEYEDVAYVTFPSFRRIEDFIVAESKCGESKCGEGNIQTDHNVFSGYLKGNDDKSALISPGALTLFLHILQKTDFQAKLQVYTDSKQKRLKPIIFVGHSLGGAIATLATLWVLGKRLRQSSPFCITFGCPLVGDERLVEAVGRENWGGNFCHVVSNHDIVPRMLLAPFQSIAKPFTTIFPYWQGINVPDSFLQDACRTLLQHVLDSSSSTYKPFGTYMFCSSNGAACIENSQTVSEMLHLTMQSPNTSVHDIVQACLLEHTRYDSVLEEVKQNSIKGRRIVNSVSEHSYEMGISLQLDAIGVGAQHEIARRALQGAGETDEEHNANIDKLAVELSLKKRSMAELEWYKEGCEKKGAIGYYDTFKSQIDKKDVRANLRRDGLARFWDDIIEMWRSHKLPSDFQSQNKWINAGTTYRKLVEPLDIAYYYRNSKDGRSYISYGRADRHRVLQKWMEDKEKTRTSRGQRPSTKPASLIEDSCFWAHVEEACKDLQDLKQGQHQRLENLEMFEKYVTTMENSLSISSDVFLEQSSFMMWWKEWKEHKKNQSPEWSSPLCEIMEKREALTLEGEKSSATVSYSAPTPPRIGRFTVGEEAETFHSSSGLPSKASEEASLAIDSEEFTLSFLDEETATFHSSSRTPSKASEEAHPTIDSDDSERFTHSVGQETASFLASCGVLSKAWEQSCLASNSEIYCVKEYEGVAYVAFPSFYEIEGFIAKECNIQTDNEVFSDCLKGNDDQPAFVHQGALKLFLHIMDATDFKEKIYTDSKQTELKPIIFVGHSLGGAVATLATLWILEKRLRQSSPFCITFGCPLVGDVRLVEAVGRENWAGNFCHVVSQYDVVPRLFLVPLESIAEPLTAILPYWQGKVPDSFFEDACPRLFGCVVINTLQFARDAPASVREPAPGAIKRSPYRPFGTYMFCSDRGSTCIENSNTVLKLLVLTMRIRVKDVGDCILEHMNYKSVLEHVIQNCIYGPRIANSNSKSSYQRATLLELNAIGIGDQHFDFESARVSLEEARDIENKRNTNVANLAIELREQHCTMAELEWYKERCEKEDVFYYDSFKMDMDADANSHREKLARFWNDIILKWERHELPSHFQTEVKWINAGTNYRRLVEPLDIAHYYRPSQGNDNYLSNGRPARHKFLQKWFEEKEKTGSPLSKLPSLTRDSCFFARVEEALKDFESLKRGQYKMVERLDEFEDYVEKMIKDGSISSDVIARIQGNPSSLQQSSSESELQVLSIKMSSST